MSSKARLWRLLRENFFAPRLVAAALLLVTLISFLDLLNPLLVMYALDTITTHPADAEARAAAFRTVLLLSALLGAAVVVQYRTRSKLLRIENAFIIQGSARLKNELYRRLQAQTLNFHAERRIGETLSHLIGDTHTLETASLELISQLPFDVITLTGLIATMIYLNMALGILVACFLLSVVLVSIVVGKKGWASEEEALERRDTLASRYQDTLSGFHTLAGMGSSIAEADSVSKLIDQHAESQTAVGEVRATVTPFFDLSEYVGIVIVLIAGGWAVLHGSLTTGGLVAFFAYMEMAADPMVRGGNSFSLIQRASVAAQRIASLLDAANDIPDAGTLKPDTIAGAVNVEKVSFGYPGGAEPALRNIDFRVGASERVAIIGRNGAGKSTLLDLLQKLQLPKSGDIRVDNLNLRDIHSSAWKRFTGVVPQETFLFNRSIAENISLGAEGEISVEEAAALSGIHEKLIRLPAGYLTEVGAKGVHFSGGERQRIAIARVFFRNPRVIFLDEPTSALDLQSEKELMVSLGKLCEGRTAFLVSHRPLVLEDVDKVVLLDRGELIAFLPPEALYREFPEYRDIFPEAWNRTDRKEPAWNRDEPLFRRAGEKGI